MPSTPKLICPTCGRPIPPNAPLGCPACLAGLAVRRADHESERGELRIASCEELAPFFPGLKIVRLLGKGGMGAVYLAHQPKLQRNVALKILHPHLAKNPEFAERFFREARVLATLTHPNIVTVYDFDQTGPYVYLILEYVEGATLRDVMRQSRIETAEVLLMIQSICDAMQYAHDQGVIHRDIKPANILLDEQGDIKIADFGLAKIHGPLHDTLTLSRACIGTMPYMAPEQIEDTATVDHRADIYSLGITFYEMLTGHLPGHDHPPPSKSVPVDPAVDRIVERSLMLHPAERYQRIAEMKSDVERAASRTGRKWGVIWGFASGVAAMMIAITVYLLFGNGIPGNRQAGADSVPSGGIQNSTQAPLITVSPVSVKSPDALAIPNFSERFTDEWTWTEPVNLGPAVNSDASDSQPCLSSDGLTLIFSSDRSSDGQWTQDLWQCRRPRVDAPWGPAEKLSAPINTNAFESDPSLSRDGLHLAFVSNRFDGRGEIDIWIGHRETLDSPWHRVENAGPNVNTGANESLGGFLVDDSELIFCQNSDPKVVSGLWRARRDKTDAAFRQPTQLKINTGKKEHLSNVYLSPDGRVVLWMGRTNSEQASDPRYDLFYATRSAPSLPIRGRTRLGGAINTIYKESGPYMAWDGKTLFFESDRPGTRGRDDIWMSQLVPVTEQRAKDLNANYALAFDGEQTVVDLLDLSLANEAHTLEMWVRAEIPASPSQILTVAGPEGAQLNLQPAGYVGGSLGLARTRTAEVLAADPSDWVHVAYVCDGQTGTLFLNGQAVSRVPKNATSNKTEGSVPNASWIGGYRDADHKTVRFPFRGEIDEVRISSVARYSESFTPLRKYISDTDTVALYHFDEGQGDRLQDSSGHNHHGTIQLPYWVKVP